MTSSISSLDTSALGVGNSGMDYFDIWTSIRPLDQHFAILLCSTLEIDWKVVKGFKIIQENKFINTQYPTDSYFVYVLKMEYVWNF